MKRSIVTLLLAGLALLAACSSTKAPAAVPQQPASQLVPTSTTTSTSEAPANSRSHPYPVGTAALVGSWKVVVQSVTAESTDPIMGSISPGYAFYVYTLQATNTSSTPAAPSTSLIAALVGSDNVSRSTVSDPMCYGGTPVNDPVYQGGSVTFGACVSVPAGDTNLVLNLQDLSQMSPVWFAIS